MAPEEIYYRSLKPPCPFCGETNTRFRYFNNRCRTPGTRISSYDQPRSRCLSPCSQEFILGGRKNDLKNKQRRSPKTKTKTKQMMKNGEDIIVGIPESTTCNPSTPTNNGIEWREDRSEAEVGTSAFAYIDDDDEAFRFFLHELFPELHGGASDILMQTEDNINHYYTSNTTTMTTMTTTTTTTYYSNPPAPRPSIGVHDNSHAAVNGLCNQITMVQPNNAHKEAPYLNQKDMHKNNEVHTTTSSLSSSTTATAVANMPKEEQYIYEELLMMLSEQELGPLSNYIADGLGAGGDEECSWWMSFDHDPFWASINF